MNELVRCVKACDVVVGIIRVRCMECTSVDS